MRTKKKHIILIVGSGRSGTSMLTEILSKAGCYLGEELIEANQFNERGYFENRRFVKFHRDVLARLNRAEVPGSATPPSSDWEKVQMPFLAALESLLKDFVGETSSEILAIKDPRASSLLPLWIAATGNLGYRLSIVLAYRDPMATIDSVVESSQCSRLMGESLFIERTCAIFDAGRPVVFFDYDQCLRAPHKVIRKLLGALDLPYSDTLADVISPKNRNRVQGQRLVSLGTTAIHKILQLCNRGLITQKRCGHLISLLTARWRRFDGLQDSLAKEKDLRSLVQSLRTSAKKAVQEEKGVEAQMRALNAEARSLEWFKRDYVRQRVLASTSEAHETNPDCAMLIGPSVFSDEDWSRTMVTVSELRRELSGFSEVYWLTAAVPETLKSTLASFSDTQRLSHLSVRKRTFEVGKAEHWLQTIRQHALHIKPAMVVISFNDPVLGTAGATVAKSVAAKSVLRLSGMLNPVDESMQEACALCDMIVVDSVAAREEICCRLPEGEHSKVVISA